MSHIYIIIEDSKYSCRFYGCGRALFQKEKQLPTPPNSQITMSDPSEEDSIECNYMVMQMLGKNLAEIRKSRPQQKFSLTTTALLGRQILNAIHDLHLKGYLHRDIKPVFSHMYPSIIHFMIH